MKRLKGVHGMNQNKGNKQKKYKRQHPEDSNMFWCPNCKSYKPREEFNIMSARTIGLQSLCKKCQSERYNIYKMGHNDKIKAQSKRYRNENKDKISDNKKKWREAHKAEEAERLCKYQLKKNLIKIGINPTKELIEEQYGKLIANREKRKIDHQLRKKEMELRKPRECIKCGRVIKAGKYCEDHKPIEKEIYRLKYNSDPEFKIAERVRTRRYKHIHPEKLSKWADNRKRLVAKSADGSINRTEIDVLLNKYKKCPYCGKSIREVNCHIDHIIPLSKGGPHSITNIIPCCPECNQKKSAESIEEWIERLDDKHKRLVKKIIISNQCYQLSLI